MTPPSPHAADQNRWPGVATARRNVMNDEADDQPENAGDYYEEGLWVSTAWWRGERIILPLIRRYADGSFDMLEVDHYSDAVRSALRAVLEDYVTWPTPRTYRITSEHLDRHPALVQAVLAGRWRRHDGATDTALT
jgi:hypothetical protein